jgi:hypothetical protein
VGRGSLLPFFLPPLRPTPLTLDLDNIMSASAKTNGGSRSSRLSTISNGQLHEQYKNRYRPLQTNGNGHAHANGGSAATSGTSTPLSFLGPRLQLLASDLEERLEAQSEKPGWSGNMARNLLERGMWLEERLENEVDLRTHAIGGIDNMWLLLSSISSFNPVCCATYTFKDGVAREGVEAMLEKQLKLFPKYRQVLRNTGRRWHGSTFVEDPNWDVKRQIFERNLPEPAGRKELDDFVSLVSSLSAMNATDTATSNRPHNSSLDHGTLTSRCGRQSSLTTTEMKYRVQRAP